MDLDAAYKREYIFLTSQKKTLMKQEAALEKNYKQAIKKAKQELEAGQEKIIALNVYNEKLEAKLFKLEQNKENEEENKILLSNTLKQAAHELKEKNVGIDKKSLIPLLDKMLKNIQDSGKRSQSKGSFFLTDGKLVEGDILHFGKISSFGHYKNKYYMLAPAGQGKLKVWREEPKAEAHFKGETPHLTSLFIYENLEQSIEKKENRTLSQFISAGGTIAWVIVWMGVLAVFLCLIRTINLNSYSKEILFIEKNSMNNNLATLLTEHKKNSSQKELFIRLLENKAENKESINDIIDEGIIHEHKIIDRFGAMILVFAAVAPLLGLLGTVTGMISTFDIITEHGTGDPKLLSHGISEALITTELGLLVAIPALLFGNMLSGWGKNIKMTLDKVALKVANGF